MWQGKNQKYGEREKKEGRKQGLNHTFHQIEQQMYSMLRRMTLTVKFRYSKR